MLNSNNYSLAIFASGIGTNALAVRDFLFENYNQKTLLITDNPDSPIAREGILVPFTSKKEHEATLLRILFEYKIDWLLLAGYMRILSGDFISAFSLWHSGANQILNIHPSLLPKYKGKDAYAKAWQSQDKYTGVSIHYVDPEVDSGEIIAQVEFEIHRNQTFESFVSKAKKIENSLYVQVVQHIVEGKIPTKGFEVCHAASL